MRRWIAGVAFLLMATVAGCKTKLDMNSLFDVPGEGRAFKVDAIKSDQTIKVSGTATGAPVNVFIYLNKNEAAADKEIMAMKYTPIILNHQDKTESFDLEAFIPANETAVVRINRATSKSAKVNLKINN